MIYRHVDLRLIVSFFWLYIKCTDDLAGDLIPVVVVEDGCAQSSHTDQNHLLLIVVTEFFSEDIDQSIDVIAITLLAKLTKQRKITSDRCRFDSDILSQLRRHDFAFAFRFELPQGFKIDRISF